MNELVRTVSILSAIAGVLIANPALCAVAGATNEAGAPPTAPASSAAPATGAATQASSAEQPAQVAAPVRPIEAQNSPSSVAASPYGPAKPPTTKSTTQSPQPAPKRGYDGPPTLLDMSGDYAIGGFGGVGVMYTRFAGSGAAQVCGEGGLILDHVLELGGGGCGVTTTVNAEKYGPEPHYADDRMRFGYGGFLIRYHLFSRSMVNLGIGALIGAGGLTIGTWDSAAEDFSSNYKHMRSEAVFVFEPHVGAYTNFTRWLRMGAVVGYRLVSGVDTQGVSASDLAAPTLGGVLQGGWF